MSIGSASFVLTSAFDSAQIQASVGRLNASVAASVKDVSIGSTLDQAKLTRVLADAQAKIAKTQANIKLGVDVQNTQIDAAIAKARVQIDALGGSATATGGDLESMGGSLGKLSNLALPALIAAGVALSPVLLTVGTGLAGLGIAAAGDVSAIIAASSATGGLAANMSTLNPVQQQMAAGLLKLEGQASTFSASLQPQLVKIWGAAVGTAGDLLGDIQPVAKAAGDALSVVIGEIRSDLKTEQWQQFFGFMASNAGPDIQLVGTLFRDLATDIVVLTPLLQPLAKGFLEVAAAASTSVSKGSSFFKSFINDVAGLENKFDHLIGSTPGSKPFQDMSDSLTGLGNSAAKSGPQVGTLAGDIGVLSSRTADATSKTQAFSGIWDHFVGKAAGDQAAVLSVKAAFDSYAQSVKTSGTNSTAAQQAFLGIITSMGSGLSTLQQNGASVDALNGFYTTNIAKLQALHGLTPTERSDIQGVTKDYDAWAESTSGLNAATATAAGTIGSQLEGQLSLMHKNVPQAQADTTAFAAAILKTGDQSSATHGARQELINDLIQAGVSSSTAKQLVNTLQQQIDALKGKNVTIGANVAGAEAGVKTFAGLVDAIPRSVAVQITAQVQGANLNQIATALTGMAAGGIVGGIPHAARGIVAGGGPSGRDSQLILAAPGELVVPTSHVPAFAGLARRAGIPGFSGRPTEPAFGKLGSMRYSYADRSGGETASAASAANPGLTGMSTYQAAEMIAVLKDLRKQGAQQPYALAAAQREAMGSGVRRAWFSTGG